MSFSSDQNKNMYVVVTTHFEILRTNKKINQSALNLGPSQPTLKKKFEIDFVPNFFRQVRNFFIMRCHIHVHVQASKN